MLTRQEIDVLIEALDSWECKDFAGEMVAMIFGSAIPKGSEARKEYEGVARGEMEKRKAEAKIRKERSILLKAKLIQLRDSNEAGAFLQSAG